MSDSPAPAKPEKPKSLKRFTVIWITQIASLLGTGLTSFALGIWVLQQTDSVTQFTTIAVLGTVPGLFFGPIAGAYVDRWNRKAVLIVSDIVPGIVTLVYCWMLYNGSLEIWHIYIGVVFNSFMGAFQWPAFIAALTMIVPREKFGRVNGMLQFGQAGTTIAAPALAGFLLLTFDIWVVLLFDVFTFLIAVAGLVAVKIPQPKESAEARANRGSILKEAMYGWTFIRERPGLLGLLLFFAGFNLIHAMAGISIIPMLLRLTSSQVEGGDPGAVGLIQGVVGVGMLLGGLYMTATGGPQRKIHGVFGLGLASGFLIIATGLTSSLWIIAVTVALWHGMIPVANGCSTVIWQNKTPPDVQGRVFAMRRLIAQFTVPLGDFSAGPLADYVFEPAMSEGGVLARSFVGDLLGTGPGRGIGAMMVFVGLLPVLWAVFAYSIPKIRDVETDLPDAVIESDDDEDGAEEASAAQEVETPTETDEADSEDESSTHEDNDGNRT